MAQLKPFPTMSAIVWEWRQPLVKIRNIGLKLPSFYDCKLGLKSPLSLSSILKTRIESSLMSLVPKFICSSTDVQSLRIDIECVNSFRIVVTLYFVMRDRGRPLVWYMICRDVAHGINNQVPSVDPTQACHLIYRNSSNNISKY